MVYPKINAICSESCGFDNNDIGQGKSCEVLVHPSSVGSEMQSYYCKLCDSEDSGGTMPPRASDLTRDTIHKNIYMVNLIFSVDSFGRGLKLLLTRP